MIEFTNDDTFLTPQDLSVSKGGLRRVVLVGACVADGWKKIGEDSQICDGCDHILFNHVAEIPAQPPFPVEDYDFQVIALPFRAILPERSYFRLQHDDITGHENLLRDAEARVHRLLDGAMRWNKKHGLTTFVANFLVPQQNAMGRLFPRYDIRNPVHFVERLNYRLAAELNNYSNAYYFDLDQIAASIGRRYIQEDAVCVASHGALLCDYDWGKDRGRIEKLVMPVSEIYRARPRDFIRAVWLQLLASFRALKQEDSVKLVVTDLDDTLWRGVIGDAEAVAGNEMEGWPSGYAEALTYLKKRGIILGIVSKNEESVIRKVWPKLLKDRLSLDDFVFVKINWKSKVENVSEIILAANLLPASVVFVDDNPVERESVKAAFPGIRVLGSDPYTIKRVLLWSSETQGLSVTSESARRTEMMKAQARREDERKAMSREEFLSSLSIQVRLKSVMSELDPHFPRVFELLNKTNQFNTTGKRWSQAQLLQAISSGSRLVTFFVEDKFSDYGLVGILLISGNHIDQYVMSCRVFGMDIEMAALAAVLADIHRSGIHSISAELIDTEANFPVRDLYKKAGFEYKGGQWRRDLEDDILLPAHIVVGWVENAPPTGDRVEVVG